jgi:hypothetical protein
MVFAPVRDWAPTGPWMQSAAKAVRASGSVSCNEMFKALYGKKRGVRMVRSAILI